MAFCSQCGAKLSDNQKFCTECGAPQAVHAAPPPVVPAPEENRTTYIPLTDDTPMERTTFLPRQDKDPYAPPQPNPYAPPQPPYEDPWQMPDTGKKPPRKKKKGGLIALILVLVLLIGGAAAFYFLGGMELLEGGKKENEEVLGLYNAVSCIYKKEEQDIEDEWLELKSGGKGKLMMDDETFSFKWELDDEDLTIIQSGDEYNGTLEDDVIVIDINGMEYTYILEDSDAEAEWEEQQEENDRPEPEAPVPEPPAVTEAMPTEAPAAPEAGDPSSLEYWAGDWYGWWVINEVYEGDPEYEYLSWDCCANLEIDSYGNGTMYVWDVDGSRNDILAEVNMQVAILDEGLAWFESTDGFFYDMAVGEGEWSCTSYDEDGIDQTFLITAVYDDGAGLSFMYTIYMRPWGLYWDDVAEINEGWLPDSYAWYLDLINAGYTEAPDTIG